MFNFKHILIFYYTVEQYLFNILIRIMGYIFACMYSNKVSKNLLINNHMQADISCSYINLDLIFSYNVKYFISIFIITVVI